MLMDMTILNELILSWWTKSTNAAAEKVWTVSCCEHIYVIQRFV